MTPMNWKQKIERWRALPPAQQARLRRSRIPLNVAESMAFEGEAVDLKLLTMELERLDTLPDTSRRASGS